MNKLKFITTIIITLAIGVGIGIFLNNAESVLGSRTNENIYGVFIYKDNKGDNELQITMFEHLMSDAEISEFFENYSLNHSGVVAVPLEEKIVKEWVNFLGGDEEFVWRKIMQIEEDAETSVFSKSLITLQTYTEDGQNSLWINLDALKEICREIKL